MTWSGYSAQPVWPSSPCEAREIERLSISNKTEPSNSSPRFCSFSDSVYHTAESDSIWRKAYGIVRVVRDDTVRDSVPLPEKLSAAIVGMNASGKLSFLDGE
ncbi:predicted protein [Sclerotinia sclerotiorum 1980 UF-70]|uniref:Uncharacterized protein n=1 Tax=Sclerotinia sclerotiorum (strain ATCC 18683 / 1980 / Ss-1) TaxID=665079 RepID=A7F2Y8_SCLS1|nr:predicted protein [Sclerotinia sclerotiorum 1980 UF-70]EDN96080.1 predicted protein [Sclerotinia sclerotiorum 1980 UF-70]